jgi:hypothetical protein
MRITALITFALGMALTAIV